MAFSPSPSLAEDIDDIPIEFTGKEPIASGSDDTNDSNFDSEDDTDEDYEDSEDDTDDDSDDDSDNDSKNDSKDNLDDENSIGSSSSPLKGHRIGLSYLFSDAEIRQYSLSSDQQWHSQFSTSMMIENSDDRSEDNIDYLAYEISGLFELNDHWEFSISFDRWGKSEAILSSGIGLEINHSRENWSLSLGGQSRTNEATLARQVRTFSSSQWSVGLELVLLSPLYLKASYQEYNFEEDLTRLDSALAQFIPDSTLSLASNYVNWSGDLALGYTFKKVWLELGLDLSESAIDLTESRSYSLVVGFQWSRNWNIENAATLSESSEFDDEDIESTVLEKSLSTSISFSW